MPFTVFLSHSVAKDDYSLVIHLNNLLWQSGMQGIVAEWMPKYGENVSQKVANQIESSNVLLAVITNTSVRSAFVNQEIGYAVGKNKLVIPLVEEPNEITGFLFGSEPLYFSRWNFTEAAQRIVAYLEQHKKQMEAQQSLTLMGLVIGGLFLWSLNQQRDYE